jgi:hypothetical protein
VGPRKKLGRAGRLRESRRAQMWRRRELGTAKGKRTGQGRDRLEARPGGVLGVLRREVRTQEVPSTPSSSTTARSPSITPERSPPSSTPARPPSSPPHHAHPRGRHSARREAAVQLACEVAATRDRRHRCPARTVCRCPSTDARSSDQSQHA